MADRFPTTTWTLISAAAGHSTGAPDALERLCADYWSPVYGFVRRKGHSREEAEDASLFIFLSNEWDRSQAQKHRAHAALSQQALDAAGT